MLLTSISSTKKFFRKTIQGFKSLFGGGDDHYQKLPKATPPHTFNSFSNNQTYSNDQLQKFYTDFTETDRNKEIKKKMVVSPPPATKQEKIRPHENEAFSRVSVKNNNTQKERRRTEERAYARSVREGRVSAVAQRLKEMEMADMSNVEHVLDIEEVLHYYSRLTCPAYLDIVDKFFMEVYAEFCGHFTASDHHQPAGLQIKAKSPVSGSLRLSFR